MKHLTILIVIISVLLFIIYVWYKVNKGDTLYKNKIKGICYFDIDDTLTTSTGDKEEIVKQCLDNNFAVGIITASNRDIKHICTGDKANKHWMSDTLCKQFNDNNGKMFNSTIVIAGKKEFPDKYPHNKSYGVKKGFDMVYGRDSFYKDVPDKCIVLFDDNPDVIKDVKHYNSHLETQCTNTYCKGDTLNKDMVLNKVTNMIDNGCK